MYAADISKATVLALFLLPVNLNKLAPKFLDTGAGLAHRRQHVWHRRLGAGRPRHARIRASIASSWCEALLWIVPAKVAGTWKMANGTMTLTQEYQMIKGTVID